jgi:hypothetical protein
MADARVYGSMHVRSACVRGGDLGKTVAAYVLSHALRSIWQDVNMRDDDIKT